MLSVAASKKTAMSKAVCPLAIKTIWPWKLILSIQMNSISLITAQKERLELCSEITCRLQINENKVVWYSADSRKTALTWLNSFLLRESFLSNTSQDFSLYNQTMKQGFSCLSNRKQINQIMHTVHKIAFKKFYQRQVYQIDMHWLGCGTVIKLNKCYFLFCVPCVDISF